MKKNKSEIRLEVVDGICYVFVLDKHGKHCFCREKTTQTVAIAHTIYMYEQYGDRHEVNARRKNAEKSVREEC
jgi:hypothetical protein